uniref:Immunoglobulin V-set domain-containing protein n=1 Tax=Felis catus TaxID=9685 RepID=A0ABI8ADH7_FELCA
APGRQARQAGHVPALLLLVIHGHFCTCQEEAERGTYGGTLTTSCVYCPGWESHKKWLCRGNDWDSCKILVKTTGSEQLVKRGRVSIQDNHSRHTFTMTLENLQWDDEDTYWCGIERTGIDIGYKFSAIVEPVTMQCHYGPEWETYVRSWCQDADLSSCTIVVQTNGSELKKNHVSINQKMHTFSMTIWGE